MSGEELHVEMERSTDMPRVKVSWTVNMPMLLTAASLIAYASWWARGVEYDVSSHKAAFESKAAQTDASLASINAIVSQMPNVLYRLGTAETQLDRLTTNVVGSIDGLRKDVGTLTTKVEVLSQKIETSPRRTVSPPL
jgi:hypothetical protein